MRASKDHATQQHQLLRISTRSKSKANGNKRGKPASKAGGKAGGKKKQKQQANELEPNLYIPSLLELPPHDQAEELLQATFDGKTAGFGLIEVEQQCEMPHDGLQAM